MGAQNKEINVLHVDNDNNQHNGSLARASIRSDNTGSQRLQGTTASIDACATWVDGKCDQEKKNATNEINTLYYDDDELQLPYTKEFLEKADSDLIISNVDCAHRRIRLENEIRESKEFSETLVESSVDGILAFDNEYRYTMWNRAMEKISGKPSEEVVGRVAFELFPFLKEVGEDECFYKSLAGETVTTEERIYTIPETGRQGYFKGIYSPIRNNSGEIIGGLGVIREITERKQMEEKICESEERFRKIFEESLLGISILDMEGHMLVCNKALSEMLGYSEEEFQDMSFLEFTHPDDVEKNRGYNEEITEGNRDSAFMEKRYIHKDGREIWVNVSANVIQDDMGNPQKIIGMAQDITERKLAERALEASEAKFRGISERIFDGIFTTNLMGLATYVSPSVSRITGYNKKETIGKHFTSFLPESETPRVEEAFNQAMKGELISNYQVKTLRKDGTLIDIEVNSSRIIENGKVVGYQGIFRDITDRVQAKERIKKFAYSLNNVEPGGCYLSDSHERFLKTFAVLSMEGVRGLSIVREDPQRLVDNYGIKREEIVILSSRPFEGYQTLADLQSISRALSRFLESGEGVVLLDGLEYLISRFGFDTVYSFIQEKRFDFLRSKAVLLVPLEMNILDLRQQALLSSEFSLLE